VLIRREQMEAISVAMLEDRTVKYLIKQYPVESSSYSTRELADLVGRSFQRAGRYGMRSQGSLQAFAVLALIAAPEFDEHPRIREILMDAELPPDFRVLLLGECTTSLDWQQVQESALRGRPGK